MAYSNFTLEALETIFGVKNQVKSLFVDTPKMQPSKRLEADLEEAKALLIRTEKARSEWIVVPILRELRNRNNNFFTIYSGEFLDVDKKKGLNGECDFILAKDTGTYSINFPIIQIVEAKMHDIDIGIPQCAAQLLGAKIFNEKKGSNVSKVYGCVTTGNDWVFMCLENNLVTIDIKRYYLNDIESILGAFQTIIDFYKQELQ